MMKHWLATATAWSGLVHAHGGHGMTDPVHWHVTDTVGFVIAGVMVAAVWWLGRNK